MAIQTLNPISDPEEIRKEMAANTQPLAGGAGQGAAAPAQPAASTAVPSAPAEAVESAQPVADLPESPVADAVPVSPDVVPESATASTAVPEVAPPEVESSNVETAPPSVADVAPESADPVENTSSTVDLPSAEHVTAIEATEQEASVPADSASSDEQSITASIEAISAPKTAPANIATPAETPEDADAKKQPEPVVATPPVVTPTPVAEEPKPAPVTAAPAEKKSKGAPDPQPLMPDGVPFMGKVSSGGDATPVSVELNDLTAAPADTKDEQTPPEEPPAKGGFLGLFSKKK